MLGVGPARAQSPSPDPAGTATGDKGSVVDAAGNAFVVPPPPDPSAPGYADAKKAYDEYKAQADKERFILESEAYSNGIIPVAQGAAVRMQQDSQAYKAQVIALAEGQASRFSQLEGAYEQSPEVTRRRLYMDTVEKLLVRAHKVLIDTHAGGNLIYLPIDKLLEKSTAREPEQAGEAASGSAAKEQDSVTVEARGRGER